MSKTRTIVKKFRVEVAEKERRCHANSRHTIMPRESHFAYEKNGRKSICKACGPKIIDFAITHINNVKEDLGIRNT